MKGDWRQAVCVERHHFEGQDEEFSYRMLYVSEVIVHFSGQ